VKADQELTSSRKITVAVGTLAASPSGTTNGKSPLPSPPPRRREIKFRVQRQGTSPCL